MNLKKLTKNTDTLRYKTTQSGRNQLINIRLRHATKYYKLNKVLENTNAVLIFLAVIGKR